MDPLLYFVILICFFVGWYYNKFHETVALACKLPGPKKLPILGNALDLANKSPPELLKLFEKFHKDSPKVTCFLIGPQPEILISNPEDAEAFLSSQKLIDKSDEYNFIGEWMGTGLLISTGQKWFQRRKIITPAFHFKILDQFVEIFDKHSSSFVKILGASKNQTIDIFQPVTYFALDVICGKLFCSKKKNFHLICVFFS
jgi:cytochrome P450 family 4